MLFHLFIPHGHHLGLFHVLIPHWGCNQQHLFNAEEEYVRKYLFLRY
jgi:hypothetical protein